MICDLISPVEPSLQEDRKLTYVLGPLSHTQSFTRIYDSDDAIKSSVYVMISYSLESNPPRFLVLGRGYTVKRK